MSEAKCEAGWGGLLTIVRDGETVTPPRLHIAFAIDPPPPGEGEERAQLSIPAARNARALP
jgi:hypothetical protein